MMYHKEELTREYFKKYLVKNYCYMGESYFAFVPPRGNLLKAWFKADGRIDQICIYRELSENNGLRIFPVGSSFSVGEFKKIAKVFLCGF